MFCWQDVSRLLPAYGLEMVLFEARPVTIWVGPEVVGWEWLSMGFSACGPVHLQVVVLLVACLPVDCYLGRFFCPYRLQGVLCVEQSGRV